MDVSADSVVKRSPGTNGDHSQRHTRLDTDADVASDQLPASRGFSTPKYGRATALKHVFLEVSPSRLPSLKDDLIMPPQPLRIWPVRHPLRHRDPSAMQRIVRLAVVKLVP